MAKRKYPTPVGQRFGKLTVLGDADKRHGNRYVTCQCDCGNVTDIYLSNVLSSRSTSCGCERDKAAGLVHRKHGMSNTRTKSRNRTYSSWQSMRNRCLNPNSEDWSYYGGAGVKICPEWDDFEIFYSDMGERPDGLTLDRVDPNKGYFPQNCRWADAHTQRINRRK